MHATHPTPQYRRILVPADGSEGARHAAQAASELARISGGRVIALHVLPPETADEQAQGFTAMASTAPLEAVFIDPVPRGEDAALRAVERIAREHGVPVDSESVVDAAAAHAIAQAAESLHCDLIVMSSNGYGSALARLTGSSAAKVASDCAVPVLVVH